MENYIVRIYRRDKDSPSEIAGLVELVEAKKKHPFKNIDELSYILCSPENKKAFSRKKLNKKK